MMQFTKGLFGVLFCVISLLSTHVSAQQAPYTGGEGDGYDMAVWSKQTAISADLGDQIQLTTNSISLGNPVEIFSDQMVIQADIHVLDIQGKEIIHIPWHHASQKSFHLPTCSPGFYFIKIKNNDRVAVKRIQILPN